MLNTMLGRSIWWTVAIFLLLILGGSLLLGTSRARTGTRGGRCYGNGTCNAGLTCFSQRCVAAAGAAITGDGTAGEGSMIAEGSTTAEKVVNAACACPDPACVSMSLKMYRAELSEADRAALDRELAAPPLAQKLAGCMTRVAPRRAGLEAALQLNKLGKNAKSAFAYQGHYPKGEVSLTPARSCCQEPNRQCSWSPSTWDDPVWKALDFELTEPFLLQYSYQSDGASFTANAVADLDCRGTTVTYRMTGTSIQFNPVVTFEGPVAP